MCATTARTTRSSLNDHRSSIDPPPRARIVTSGASLPRPASASAAVYRSTLRSARTIDSGAPSPWTWQATSRTRAIGHRRANTWHTSFHAAPVGDETTAMTRGRDGSGRFRSTPNRPSAASFALSCSNRIARSPTPLGWIEST